MRVSGEIQVVDGLLFHERHYQDEKIRLRCTEMGWRQSPLGIFKVMDGQSHLLHVVAALHSSGGLAGGLNGGQQQGDQDADDRNDDKKFDERETRIFAGYILAVGATQPPPPSLTFGFVYMVVSF